MESFFEFGKNVVGVVIDQEIDEDMVEEIQNIIEERMGKNGNRISVYVEDKNNDGMSVKAVLKHLAYHIKQPEVLKKVAVVTDVKWVQMVMEMKDLFTESELETFPTEDRLLAMNWITE